MSKRQRFINQLHHLKNDLLIKEEWKNELLDKEQYFLPDDKWQALLKEEKEDYGVYGDKR